MADYQPTSYKSLKDLRKNVGKKPPVTPLPSGGGESYSGSGGYGSYGSNDGSYAQAGQRLSTHGTPGGTNPANTQRRGWSGSVENQARVNTSAAADTYTPDSSRYSSDMSRGNSMSTPMSMSREDSTASGGMGLGRQGSMGGGAPTTGAKPSRWGFGRTNSSATTESRQSYHESPGTGAAGAGEQPAQSSGSRWKLGRKNTDDTTASASEKRGWSGRGSSTAADKAAASQFNDAVRDPATGRYVPPSARTSQGAAATASYATRDPVTGRYIPPSERVAEGEEKQTWTQWASDGATNAWSATSSQAATAWAQTQKTAQDSWDNVNNAHKRDQALSSVGSGAAKVAGGAIKLAGKGIWAVGKAATR